MCERDCHNEGERERGRERACACALVSERGEGGGGGAFGLGAPCLHEEPEGRIAAPRVLWVEPLENLHEVLAHLPDPVLVANLVGLMRKCEYDE